jgi:DNA processing protein
VRSLPLNDAKLRAVSPFLEIGAYEALWDEDDKASFRVLADKFRNDPGAVPSDFVSHRKAREYALCVLDKVRDANLKGFGVRLYGTSDYPSKLRDASDPIELLYFQGWWDLAEDKSVAVVGTRKPSAGGIARTRELVKNLVEDGFTIVSGLAAGIDTTAHLSAIESGGRTIAVIGTPLSETYPKENRELQSRLAEDYLVISQVPFCRYHRQSYRINRFFFPARNVTMAALSQATIIVEAGETSGTLVQAKAALDQGRKLFILDNCFRNPSLTWPAKFARQGAIRVSDYEGVRHHLGSTSDPN